MDEDMDIMLTGFSNFKCYELANRDIGNPEG
jgi:hypothetical protein